MPIPHGARFYRADLHTHTPASHDYGDKAASAKNILTRASDAGIEILAITDHNSAGWIDRMRTASVGSSVHILPGVEITTPEGHILALFPTDHSAEVIADFLVAVGIPRAQHGRKEAISTDHAEEIIRKVDGAGGVAIAAHANEKSSGLLQVKGQFKMKVVPMPELAALEFTKQADIDRFCAGTVSPDYPPKPCVQSSDSHNLVEIGRRTSFLKMHEPGLNGIRQAFLDHDVRVRFPWNNPDSSHPRILSLKVDQGFFGGVDFVFDESLNCLVGGKGTGKSTTIELLRYCFDDPSTFPHIRKDHDGKIRSLVGEGGTIEVQYQDSDGDIKTVRREVQSWETERETADSAGNLTTIVVPPVFFSQGELVDIARSPIAQLDLLDQQLDLATENRDEEDCLRRLAINAKDVVSGRKKLASLQADVDNPERGLAATRAHHATLERQLAQPVLKDFPKWESEQQYLQNLDGVLEQLKESVTEALEDVDLSELSSTLPVDCPNAISLKPLATIEGEVKAIIVQESKKITELLDAVHKRLAMAAAKVAPMFVAKKTEYDGILAGLGQADVRKASANHRTLGKRLESLTRSQAEQVEVLARLKKLDADRKRLLEKLAISRHKRFSKRTTKANAYGEALHHIVTFGITHLGDRSEFAKQIRELSRTARIPEDDVQKIARTIDPSALLDHVSRKDSKGLETLCGITQAVSQRLIEGFSSKDPETLFGIETVPMADLPEITYEVEPGRRKSLDQLSTGQKGTVIIDLAMIEGSGPLVIDHPEEPLDTKAIHGNVVSTLRKGKDRRQFVFTTHNANVAVGADAELSHILGATADKGIIESTGGVDHPKTNDLLLLHLEGGPEALTRRVKKYGMKLK